MTNTDANAVLDRMEADEEFATRVKDAGGPEASLEMLRAEGFDVAAQDLRDAVLDRYGDVITAEQLDSLAGGFGIDLSEENSRAMETGVWIGIGTGLVAVGAASAAAV